jgi:hypothetical protein
VTARVCIPAEPCSAPCSGDEPGGCDCDWTWCGDRGEALSEIRRDGGFTMGTPENATCARCLLAYVIAGGPPRCEDCGGFHGKRDR